MATGCTGVGSVDVLVLPVEGAVSGAAVEVRDWLLVEGEVGPAHESCDTTASNTRHRQNKNVI